MGLDLRGFTAPASEFGALHHMADGVRQENRYEQQLAQQKRAQGAASAKFLADYLDPKDHLTGSPYDPEIVKGFQDLLSEGMKLAGEGADTPMLMMALAPKVGRLNEYSTKAKLLNERGEEFVKQVKGVKGIDAQKALSEYRNRAFYETDPQTGQPKLKDISSVDVDKDYGDEVLRNGEVYTNEGLDEWVKGLKPNVDETDATIYDQKGHMRRTKVRMSAPSIYQPEVDEKGVYTRDFIPKHQIATDDGNPIIHEFQTEKGGVKAPVRMVTDEVFNTISPKGKAYLLQEARKYAKMHGVSASSVQAENFAKVLAYDELKNTGKVTTNFGEVTVDKPSNPEIRNYFTGNPYPVKSGNGSGPNGEMTINDVDGDIEEAFKTKAGGKEHYLGINDLPSQAQDVVMDGVAKSLGFRVGLAQLKIKKDASGRKGVYAHTDIEDPNTLQIAVKAGTLIRTLDRKGVNYSKQPGAKEKRAVAAEGNPAPIEQPSTKKKISW